MQAERLKTKLTKQEHLPGKKHVAPLILKQTLNKYGTKSIVLEAKKGKCIYPPSTIVTISKKKSTTSANNSHKPAAIIITTKNSKKKLKTQVISPNKTILMTYGITNHSP